MMDRREYLNHRYMIQRDRTFLQTYADTLMQIVSLLSIGLGETNVFFIAVIALTVYGYSVSVDGHSETVKEWDLFYKERNLIVEDGDEYLEAHANTEASTKKVAKYNYVIGILNAVTYFAFVCGLICLMK